MDKQRGTGILVGMASTILVLGGLVTAGATAMGVGGMDGMMDECRETMAGHPHDGEGSHDHDGNGTEASSEDGDAAHAGPALIAADAGDGTVEAI